MSSSVVPGARSTFSHYAHYILNVHAWAQLIWHITKLEFTVCTFTASLCLARDAPVPVEGGSDSPPT